MSRKRWTPATLACLSHLAAFLQAFIFSHLRGMPPEQILAQRWPVLPICLYVPALAIALRPERAAPPEHA